MAGIVDSSHISLLRRRKNKLDTLSDEKKAKAKKSPRGSIFTKSCTDSREASGVHRILTLTCLRKHDNTATPSISAIIDTSAGRG